MHLPDDTFVAAVLENVVFLIHELAKLPSVHIRLYLLEYCTKLGALFVFLGTLL